MVTPTTNRPANRLLGELSPYLRQHAYNPVDWYPWGEAAFAKARAENKPIFLSIGYSTCHWCHVMERESFENDLTAALMNAHFVSIKVDREERPDLDKIYMTAVQAVTGTGGWPMSVWLNHQLEPFFCGTYFPPETRWGRPGFPELLERIHQTWESNPDGLRAQADQIGATLRQHLTLAPADAATALDDAPLAEAVAQFRATFDELHGGFGTAPKFPRPAVLQFLLRRAARARDETASAMAEQTLEKMGRGGLFDQLGGGFHRYSVDSQWLVSHFEKMLYDQAQLLASYVEAFQLTGQEFHADIARRTAEYVLRDLAAPDGGFYAAEDADSEGVEGKFYVWTKAEIAAVLGAAGPGPALPASAAEVFCRVYGVEAAGNWEHGLNILHRSMSDEEVAKMSQQPLAELGALLATARARLLAVRAQRVRPHRDEKIITAWNGLMIAALAKAAAAGLDRDRYTGVAARAARFLLVHHRREGRLGRTATVPAVLDDYAWLATALLELYTATFDPDWLAEAVAVADELLRRFHDPDQGGFFLTTGEDPSVIVRTKEDQDGAEPSGNSVAALLLLRLADHTGRADYRQAAAGTLRLFGQSLQRYPQAVPLMLCALDAHLAPVRQVVIVGPQGDPAAEALRRVVQQRFLPTTSVLWADGGPWQARLAEWLPHLRDLRPVNGRPAAYLCEQTVCRAPVTEPEALAEMLGR